jgi:dihydrofolate reductase
MRKLIASLYLSLDGVMEAPETWHFDYLDDQMLGTIQDGLSGTEGFLLGRRTYEEWAAFWPNQPADDAMARVFNARPKFVASSTLTEATWQNSTIVRPEGIAELKQGPGGDLSVVGSATLVRSLLRDGLLDELRLLVHPLVVGSGRRLFEDGMPKQPLELVASEAFTTGVLNLTYRPAA